MSFSLSKKNNNWVIFTCLSQHIKGKYLVFTFLRFILTIIEYKLGLRNWEFENWNTYKTAQEARWRIRYLLFTGRWNNNNTKLLLIRRKWNLRMNRTINDIIIESIKETK